MTKVHDRVRLSHGWLRADLHFTIFGSFLFFMVVRFLDVLDPPFYLTIYRVTYLKQFDFGFLPNSLDNVLLIVWSSSLALYVLFWKQRFRQIPFVIATILITSIIVFLFPELIQIPFGFAIGLSIYYLHIVRASLKKHLDLILLGFIVSFTIVEILALVKWVINLAWPSQVFSSDSWKYAYLEAQIMQAISNLSPFLLMVLAYSFLFWSFRNTSGKYKKIVEKFSFAILEHASNKFLERYGHAILVILVIIGIVLPLIPYNKSLNESDYVISVDVVYYSDWLRQLDQQPDKVSAAFSGIIFENKSLTDRPLTLLILYSFTKLTSLSIEDTVRYFPIVLVPVTVLSTYFFVLVGTGRKTVSLICSGLALTSPLVLAGIYAGFFANWLSLAFTIVSFTFLMVAFERKRYAYYPFFIIFAILAILSFRYILWFILGSTIIFLILHFVSNRHTSWRIKDTAITAIMLVVLFLIDLAHPLLLGIESTPSISLEVATRSYAAEDFDLRWNNLKYVLSILVAGVYSNPIVLALSVVFALLVDIRKVYSNILLAMIFVAGVSIIFAHPFFQLRMFFMMPLHITAGLGAVYLLRSKSTTLHKLLLMFVLISLIVFAVRYLSNLYLVLPS